MFFVENEKIILSSNTNLICFIDVTFEIKFDHDQTYRCDQT